MKLNGLKKYIISVLIVILIILFFTLASSFRGKDCIVYLNEHCQIGRFPEHNSLYCDKFLSVLVEDVYKYRIIKDKKTIYVIGQNKGHDVYAILNYENFRFIEYGDYNYCNKKEKAIFNDISKFKKLN